MRRRQSTYDLCRNRLQMRKMRHEKSRRMGKCGTDLVEAAIVLPVLILVILSLILLMVYFYHCLTSQTALHAELLTKSAQSDAVFKTLEQSRQVSEKLGGLSAVLMETCIKARCYVFAPAAILRTGELIGID